MARQPRLNSLSLVGIASIFLLVCGGCGSKAYHVRGTTELTQAYDSQFKSLHGRAAPQLAQSRSIVIRESDGRGAWNAALAISHQHGPIIYTSMEEGVIIAPPYIVELRQSPDALVVQASLLEGMIEKISPDGTKKRSLSKEEANSFCEEFISAFQQQYASQYKLKPEGRWDYLKSRP